MVVKPRILIVDDDRIGVELFTRTIQGRFETLQADSVSTAWQVLEKRHDIQIIVTNVLLDNLAGIHFNQEIKRQFPHIKRILLCPNQPSELLKDYFSEDDSHLLLRKPWNLAQLTKVLEEFSTTTFFDSDFLSFNKKIFYLQEIIHAKNLVSYFQPIVQFNNYAVMGQEVFTHGPANSAMQLPETLINIAHKGGLMFKFEEAARATAIDTLKTSAVPSLVFLNNCPSVIMNPEFENILVYDQVGLKPQNIVIEITETERIDNLQDLVDRLSYYKARGFKISVDDVGKSTSALFLVTKLKPHFVKLDALAIGRLEAGHPKVEFVRNLLAYCRQNNIQVIAENIEHQKEFEALRELGVTHGQGYFFSRPKTTLQPFLSVP